MSTRGSCVNCGTPLAGEWCHACGERDPHEQQLSIRAFLRERFELYTTLHARAPRTVAALIARPGELTREYMAGRRTRWLHPFELFLLANLCFFLTLSFTGVEGLSSSLRSQLDLQFYSDITRDAIRDRFASMDSVNFEVFEARFNLATEIQAKTLVALLIPMFALVLFLTRSWKREPGVHHLVFSTHFIAFALLLFIGIGAIVRATAPLPLALRQRLVTENTVTIFAMLAAAAYLFPALRLAYGDRPASAAARALLLGFLLIALLALYRFILFFTVLYSV